MHQQSETVHFTQRLTAETYCYQCSLLWKSFFVFYASLEGLKRRYPGVIMLAQKANNTETQHPGEDTYLFIFWLNTECLFQNQRLF